MVSILLKVLAVKACKHLQCDTDGGASLFNICFLSNSQSSVGTIYLVFSLKISIRPTHENNFKEGFPHSPFHNKTVMPKPLSNFPPYFV